jgi:hypothetical protein
MSFDPLFSPATISGLDSVDQATRILRESRARLGDLAVSAGHVSTEVDWRAPSAEAFHDAVEHWRSLLVTTASRADDVLDVLARARADIQALAWAEQP